MEVIPAIDLLGGQCVRLYQGDFERVTEYSADPRAIARRYREAGLDRLHVVDLDGAKSGVPGHLDLITELTGGVGVAVQVGGGIREFGQVRALLGSGAERVVIGSTAIRQPDEVIGWLGETGPEGIVLGLDVRCPQDDDPVALTHGWTEDSGLTLWALMDRYMAAGARHVLCTDIARDGTLEGPNVDLYSECTRRYPEARFIASGGVSGADDLPTLAATGVTSVVTGKALLDGRLTLEEIAQFLRDA